MNFIIRGIIILFLGVFSLTAYSQSGKQVQKTIDKRQEQLDKQETDKKKKAAKETEEKKKRHYDMQTKEVQKRIKRTQKKSKRYNDNKKEFFLKRWFRRR